jgi:hypothetical protein
MRVGVLTHMNLTPEAVQLVSDAMRAHLAIVNSEIVGASSDTSWRDT